MGRILVVEDDQVVRRLVAHVLSQAGHEVTEASSGGQAFRLLEESGAFAALVLDLNMGMVSGWRLLEEIDRRQLRGDMRVVVLSGRSGEDEILRGWLLGVDDYCTKPFDPYLLLGAVEEVINASPAELERRRKDQVRKTELFNRLIAESATHNDPPPAEDLIPDGKAHTRPSGP